MNYYETQSPAAETGQSRKQKKARTFAIVLLAVLVLSAAGVYFYNKILSGQPSMDVTVSSASLTADRIKLSGSFNGFAGLGDYNCMVDEDIAIIELYPALPVAGVSRDFSLEITGDFSGVSEINLTDGRNSLVVWTYGQPDQSMSDDNQ